jgi:hypothetical protein
MRCGYIWCLIDVLMLPWCERERERERRIPGSIEYGTSGHLPSDPILGSLTLSNTTFDVCILHYRSMNEPLTSHASQVWQWAGLTENARQRIESQSPTPHNSTPQ